MFDGWWFFISSSFNYHLTKCVPLEVESREREWRQIEGQTPRMIYCRKQENQESRQRAAIHKSEWYSRKKSHKMKDMQT